MFIFCMVKTEVTNGTHVHLLSRFKLLVANLLTGLTHCTFVLFISPILDCFSILVFHIFFYRILHFILLFTVTVFMLLSISVLSYPLSLRTISTKDARYYQHIIDTGFKIKYCISASTPISTDKITFKIIAYCFLDKTPESTPCFTCSLMFTDFVSCETGHICPGCGFCSDCLRESIIQFEVGCVLFVLFKSNCH